MSVDHGRFMERSGVLPTTQFANRKCLGTSDVLLRVSHTLQSTLESGQEGRIVQIDFSAAFDRVIYQGSLYKLCTVGIGGSVLSVLTQFQSNRSQHVMMDGCRSKLVKVVSGVPQQCFVPVIVPLGHLGALFHLENKLIGYADWLYSTLMDVMSSPGFRVIGAESLIPDLGWVSEWFDLCGMKLNASKTRTMIVRRSRQCIPSHLH